MTGSNASYQQQLGLGVDAMMSSSCFLSGDGSSSVISADTAPFVHHVVPEYTPHGSSFGFGFGQPTATTSFSADGSALLAGQLLRATALQSVSVSPEEEETHGAYGDVTVAHHAPRMMMPKQQLIAGEPPNGHGGGWIHEPPSYYYCPTTAWFTGGDPFTGPAPASELSLRLRAAAGSSPTAAGAVSVSLPDQSSEVSSSAGSGPSPGGGLFQLPPCGGGAAGTGQAVARPAGPVHFAQVLSRWPGYADITQQALDEFVSCLLQDVTGFAEPSCRRLPSPSCCSSKTTTPPSVFAVGSAESSEEEHNNNQNKLLRNHLQKLLQLMDQRCKECMDEIQGAASKYGSLVHPGGGGLSAPFAHRAVSEMHRRLRARITGEIAAAAATRRRGGGDHREQQPSSSSLSLADRERSWESAFIQKHWALRQLRRGDQQSWRPQRGLPEKSVAVLKAWMFENFLRPYPKDNEKEMLAARSGLSRSQVSNWFINARVRLWKPMIEEMYEDLKKTSGGMEGV